MFEVVLVVDEAEGDDEPIDDAEHPEFWELVMSGGELGLLVDADDALSTTTANDSPRGAGTYTRINGQ